MVKMLELVINRIPGLRGDDAKKMLLRFKSVEELTGLSKNDAEQFLDHTIKPSWSWDKLIAQAETDNKKAELRGIKIVSLQDKEYPPLMREIFDPPVVIFYRGVLPEQDKNLTAIVGTRRPSSSASAQAYTLGREFGHKGYAVVSGLANGIDALAHRGNIDGGGKSIAVLGSGPDMIYPVANRSLARRVLETGGCIMSEYAPGTSPRKWNFPARNRIISALSRAVIVVEAPAKSGALITAEFALEHDRDLFVGTVGVNSRIGKGTQRLAEDGAKAISSASVIIDEWENLT